VLFCPSRDQGAKRSGVATATSEVSFIEQIGDARTGMLPSSERAVLCWSLPFTLQNGADWRLNVIWRVRLLEITVLLPSAIGPST
jgi:hypothetical protein